MSYTLTTKVSWSQTMQELRKEFSLWGIGVNDWDITTPRGYRLSSWSQSVEDRTVILSFMKNGKEVVLEYGKQSRAVDNLRALYLTINDMRMTEKRGVGDLVGSAYKQLAAPEGSIKIDPYKELGTVAGLDLDVYEAVYRTMARKYHPDAKPSGNAEKMDLLNQAIKMIRQQNG